MPKPVIRRVSPARKQEDGFYHLTGRWTGRPMPIYEGDRIGLAIALERAEDEPADPMTLTLQVLRTDETPFNTGSEVTFKPGQGAVYDFAITFPDPPRLVTLIVRIAEKADPENRVDQKVEVYSGELARFAGDVTYPATEDAIAALSAQTPHDLCDDHLAFLRGRNGLDFVWWQVPGWPVTTEFISDLNAFEESWPEELGLLSDVTYLFGCVPDHPFLGYPQDLGDMGFFHADYLQHIIPIAVDGGGNLLVQALSTQRRGKIYFLDHEYHYGLVEEACGVIREGDAEAFWQFMEPDGAAILCADSLDDMIQRLTRYNTVAMAALADWKTD
ncbi:MAG: SMI1/KNR4 family protein [Roseovarius sp.]